MRLSTGPYPALRRRADYLLRHDPKRDLYCVRSWRAVVGRLDAVAVLTARLLPAPLHRRARLALPVATRRARLQRVACGRGLSSRQAESWPARQPPLRPARGTGRPSRRPGRFARVCWRCRPAAGFGDQGQRPGTSTGATGGRNCQCWRSHRRKEAVMPVVTEVPPARPVPRCRSSSRTSCGGIQAASPGDRARPSARPRRRRAAGRYPHRAGTVQIAAGRARRQHVAVAPLLPASVLAAPSPPPGGHHVQSDV